jgi:hypothetical protein
MLRAALFALAALGAGLRPAAQSEVPQPGPQNPPAVQRSQDAPLDPITQQALERLAASLEELRLRQQEALARQDLAAASAAATEREALQWQFANLATRLDVREFEQPSAQSFHLEDEVVDLVRPLLTAIRSATEGPRQIAELRRDIDLLLERQRTAEAALRQAERTRDALPAGSAARGEAERELRERWQPLLQKLRRDILVLQSRLSARAEAQPSLWTSVWQGAGRFLENSGLSLLLAVLVFSLTFGALRWVRRRVLVPLVHGQTFAHRLVDLLAQTLIVLVALAAMIVVPYARNDWLLLAIGIVFLLGTGWLLVRTAPQLFEQCRLLLNVGAVREGERLVVDGIPYRVAALRLYAWLENPDLQGGRLRLPVRELVSRYSRPNGDGEPWFPCRRGDVVQLADGVVGPVVTQTPQVVVVADYDAARTYTTAEFLRQKPRNLSAGFSLLGGLRLDYALLARGTDALANQLAEELRAGLAARLPEGGVAGVVVRMAQASESALEFEAVVHFDGAVAPRFFEVRAAIQEQLVAAAARHRLPIPFPQLTVHGADLR